MAGLTRRRLGSDTVENLTRLRQYTYERDKHDAGWGAADGVSVAYVWGHTCAVDTRSDPRGRKQTDARSPRHDYGNGNGGIYGYGFGDGNGNGDGYGYGYGYNYGFGFGDGNGDGDGDGNGDGYDDGRGERLWRI